MIFHGKRADLHSPRCFRQHDPCCPQAAKDRFAESTAGWRQRCPAIVRLWTSSWAEFVPFLEYDLKIRRSSERPTRSSRSTRNGRPVRARGHFPNETAALKRLYLVTKSLDPTGGGRAPWVMRWRTR
ncbi:transposase [uncultured Arthrobacter sp.]|uniref:transposase n=1 Tax=uncultured Arthrobacter sp. TaxID=114050 RepID=UPI0028D52FF7|nr:transposase [uncultured Arthrobacter sp.]